MSFSRRENLDWLFSETNEASARARATEEDSEERAEPAVPVVSAHMLVSTKIQQLEARIEKLEEIIKSRGSFEF